MAALAPGTRLGPYEIAEPLGAGGMGEVYRARDTRLDRSVAIKVLPAHFAEDADRRRRFEREARVVAGLNHPNICALYDVGRQDGLEYLVLEVLEGETLAARLSKGPLPLDQVLRFGIEIAGALDRAHRRGVIHRDLKPGNIMLTRSGSKLLDFGLAKLHPSVTTLSDSEISDIATEEMPLTGKHTIMGTIQYMAPEQVEGKEADGRTDVFALGTILYEMATGRRAFRGQSKASLAAAILNSEPPSIASLQPLTPPALDRLVRASLAKDPDDRVQSAHDVMLELLWIRDAASEGGVPAAVLSRRKTRERALLGMTVASMAVAGAFGVLYSRGTSIPPEPVRLSILPPAGNTFCFGPGETVTCQYAPPAVSPDGRSLVFGAVNSSGIEQLWVRSLDVAEPRILEGTEEGRWPFWSPDGRFIAFFAKGRLRKIPVSGGQPQVICDMSGGFGAWSRVGTILFSTTDGPLYQVSDTGGTAVPATDTPSESGPLFHAFPTFLSDGRRFLFLVWSPSPAVRKEICGIYRGELGSKEIHRVLPDASNVQAARGQMFYVRDRALLMQPFDGSSVSGAPIILEPSVQTLATRGVFSVSETGVVAYRRMAAPRTQLAWYGRDGRAIEKVGDAKRYEGVRLSSDGRRAALVVRRSADDSDIWSLDFAAGTETRLTFEPGSTEGPVWSPDNRRIVYTSWSRGYGDLVWKYADGAGEPQVLLQGEDFKVAEDWSPDGRQIVFTRQVSPTSRTELFIYSFADGKVTPFAGGDANYYAARFSPDGRWLSYVSEVSGHAEVYVRPVTGTAGQWQVSAGALDCSRAAKVRCIASWRHDGAELIYVAPDGQTKMSVPVVLGPIVKAGRPRPLSSMPLNWAMGDNGSDEQRFLLGTPVPDVTPPSITVILNAPGLQKR
jgi:Tol biopolymer transport system component